MPVHDWTRVDAGIFHDFHHAWIEEIKRALNRGLLPPGYYALAEQIMGGIVPDVLTLQQPTDVGDPLPTPDGGISRTAVAPRARYSARAETPRYATKANAVVIRHRSRHRIVAMVEIVSPGNKHSRRDLRRFVDKAVKALARGIHLLIVDLFPPGPRAPQGIHKAIWDEIEVDKEFALPADQPLTLAAYIGDSCPEAFVDFAAVGAALPDMPLFLTDEVYVPVPLEATYQSAWEAVPAFWRDVLEGRRTSA
jgi:hypothetical protein